MTRKSQQFLIQALTSAFAVVMMVAPPNVKAQVDRGSISGTVTEKTGGVLKSAKLTIRNTGTGQEAVVFTDDQGNYAVRLLIAGIYTVKIENSGFRTIARESVEVHVDQVTTENFVLQVGSVTEEINVEGSASLIDTETSSCWSGCCECVLLSSIQIY